MTRAVLVVPVVLSVFLAAPAGAEPGVTATEIVLGCSNSLTGPLAFAGEQMTRFGVDLYFKAANEAGGIHGRRVRTVYYDDGYHPHDALTYTKKLVEEDQVFAVIAPQGQPVTAMLAYLGERRVPLLLPLQGAPAMRGRKYVFGGMMLYDRQSRLMIDYLVKQRKLQKFGAIYQDDEYGKAFLEAFARDLGRHGLKLLAAESIKRGAADMSGPVARLRAARPEVVFVVLTPGPGAQVLRQRQKTAWTDVVMVSVGPLTDERYLSLASDAAEGVEGLAFWPDPRTSELRGVRRYRELMQAHFPGNPPNRYSLSGYFAAMLFTEAAQRAGKTLTRERLITALESIRDWDSEILPPITVGPDHETQKQGFWVRVQQGHFTPVTDWLKSE